MVIMTMLGTAITGQLHAIILLTSALKASGSQMGLREPNGGSQMVYKFCEFAEMGKALLYLNAGQSTSGF